MSDVSGNTGDAWRIESPAGVKAPVAGSDYYRSGAAPWMPSGAEGFWLKALYEDVRSGEKTVLMKVDPGAFAPMHVHEGELEQIFVIDGSFHDQNRVIEAGDYCCRAPGTPHESGSTTGAIVMLIYSRGTANAG